MAGASGAGHALVLVRPREIVRSRAGQRLLRSLLRAAYGHPSARADTVLAGTGLAGTGLAGRRRLLVRAEVNPGAPVAEVTPSSGTGSR